MKYMNIYLERDQIILFPEFVLVLSSSLSLATCLDYLWVCLRLQGELKKNFYLLSIVFSCEATLELAMLVHPSVRPFVRP